MKKIVLLFMLTLGFNAYSNELSSNLISTSKKECVQLLESLIEDATMLGKKKRDDDLERYNADEDIEEYTGYVEGYRKKIMTQCF